MGIIANLAIRITLYNLRSGSARDVSHLTEVANGHATVAVAAALGHSESLRASGVTAAYIDNSNFSF